MKNPWTEITPDMNVKVLSEDICFVNGINEKYRSKNPGENDWVCTEMWPAPFLGAPNAPVYLLNGNPGGDGLNETEKILLEDPLFTKLLMANLRHESIPGYDDFIFNNMLKFEEGRVCLASSKDEITLSKTKLENNKVLGGCIWWKKRTNELCRTIGKNPNLFVVEYFPYNSKDSKCINRSQRLPSYEYSDDLIKEAMKSDKLIVIMRWKQAWCERIAGLAEYPNLLEISSDSSVFLSSGNLLPFDKSPKKNRRNPDNKKKAWIRLIQALE